MWVGCHLLDYDEAWYEETYKDTFRPRRRASIHILDRKAAQDRRIVPIVVCVAALEEVGDDVASLSRPAALPDGYDGVRAK